MKIPNNYLPVMPYLIVKDAYKFIDFMKAVFNAEVRYLAPRDEGIIMHAELQIQDAVIMFADATDVYKPLPAGMFLYLEGVDEIFERALANGAVQLQELADRDYGHGGGFADAFGNQWWVNTPIEK
jgi:uncharacterized glyoxalase superfamily protein PhnB